MMQSVRTEFRGAAGHMLAASLETPAGAIKAYALFAHCFTCGKDVFAASRIARALSEGGIAVLRFDFTGLAIAKAILPTPIFHRMWRTWWPLPLTCASGIGRRPC